MSPKVLLPLANGSEELEAITIANVLLRGNCEVIMASCSGSLDLYGARKIPLKATKMINECQNQSYDMIVVPGGLEGTKNLSKCNELNEMLLQQKKAGKWVAGICAAPAIVFKDLNILPRSYTAYPGFDFAGVAGSLKDTPYEVCTDQKFITGKGPGTAMAFALKCLESLQGKDTAKKVAEGLLVDSY